MIERLFIDKKVKNYNVKEYIGNLLNKQGYSHCEITKTPLGMKVIIHTSKPGLVVGRGGENIRNLTDVLKNKFKMQSPQIEVREVENPEINANIMAGRIAFQLTRFGVSRFKSIGYRSLHRIMSGGNVRGAEILLAGKVPGKRSRNWRFYSGSLPKCGNISDTKVEIAKHSIKLKSGVIGITVKILHSDVRMPDDVRIMEDVALVVEEKVDIEVKKKVEKKTDAIKKKVGAKKVKSKVEGEKGGSTKKSRDKKDE